MKFKLKEKNPSFVDFSCDRILAILHPFYLKSALAKLVLPRNISDVIKS